MINIKKALSLLMALIVALAVLPAAQVNAAEVLPVEETYLDSGLFSIPKLTKAEITALLEANPINMPSDTSDIFDEQPSCSAPYSPGAMNAALLQRAAERLNALRNIAGLQDVVVDEALCANAQYGAVLLAASTFSHYPPQPEDMDDDFYSQASAATSSSNIYAGKLFLSTLDGFMDDPGTGNLPMLGHRRWQLNPRMGRIGFGYAVKEDSQYRNYTCEKVFDTSNTPGDYNFISWPSSGNFPNNTASFAANTAWSVTLNPNRYSTPSMRDIVVTVVREADGYEWVLPGTETYTAATSGRYLNVDTAGYGVSNCIIFRPDEVDGYFGTYTVRIDGIKTKSGSAVDFAYRVNFFDATPLTAAPSEALNYPGGDLAFETNADHPFYYAEQDGRTVGVSGNAGAGGTLSYVTVTVDCEEGDVISFDYRFRPQNNYDVYEFTMDGIILQQLSETNAGWETFTYTVERAGVMTFRWSYSKRFSYNSGEDTLMLDNIRIIKKPSLTGDADGNGILSFADVAALYGIILYGGELAPGAEAVCDVNGDGLISFADVAALYNYVLAGRTE